MYPESELTLEEALNLADQAVFNHTDKHLTDSEIKVLRGAWANLNYEQIAEQYDYSHDYIRGHIGNKLWHKLSDALGEPVKKSNFRSTLNRQRQKQRCTGKSNSSPYDFNIEYPEGPVALDSPLYVERLIERECYQVILQPGALIRIKAPKQMGKTSLLQRLLAHASQKGYKTLRLNLRQAVLTNIDQLLRWFCVSVSNKLNLDSQLNNYWDEDLGSKSSCTNYFQGYLLAQITSPLVLGLDEVELLFEYPEIAKQFLGMLRSWHEDAKTIPIWKQLKLVVVHSTEVTIRFPKNQSPFNVGIPIQLLEFNSEQVQDLAQRHGLKLSENEAKKIMSMVGGHPFLVRLAFYHLSRQNITLPQLLQTAATPTGIYRDHLHRHLTHLQRHPELITAMKTVLNAETPIALEPILAYKLEGLGLVQLQGNDCHPSCNLYRIYFRDRL